MTALECLKILRKMVIVLIVWNVLLTGFIAFKCTERQEEKQNQEICNLEAILDDTVPTEDLIYE